MKKVIGIIVVLSITAYFSSCKKIYCSTPVISKVLFYSTISTYVVPDTTATLIKSVKGSHFGQTSEIYPTINLTKVDFNRSLSFPDKGVDVYDYDWQITLHPSGRLYQITKISHQNSTSKTSDCTNTVSYYINDSLVTVPGNPYSSIPNFVSDIQILYQ